MQLASALTVSSDPGDIAELAASVLIGVAIVVLVVSGIRARRRSSGAGRAMAKGNLRMVAAGALLVLLGLSVLGSLRADDDEPTTEPTPTTTATTATTDEPQVFASCDEASAEFKRLYEQLLQRGSQGDVAGMKAAAETQLQTTTFNEGCFSKRSTAAVNDVVTRLEEAALPPTLQEQVSESCRPAVLDAVRLLNTALVRKAAGDQEGATRLSAGFASMGTADPTCLPAELVQSLELQVARASLGRAAAQ